MADDDFHKLLTAITSLSTAQLTTLDAAIRSRLDCGASWFASADTAPDSTGQMAHHWTSITDIDECFASAPRCPHCQSTTIGKWGSANRLKRYRCQSCKATFNALTGTPPAQLHKRELWIGHAQTLVDGLSLRKSQPASTFI